jgi:hypothetical protein
MKNNQSTQNPMNQIINLLLQLLDWLTHLELSDGHIVELDIGQGMSGSSLMDSIKRNKKYIHQAKSKSKIKPNNRLTKLILQLHHWLSHLELSGGFVGEQDVGQLLSKPAYSNSIKGKNIK